MFDLIILGAGTSGMRAAVEAARLGKKVALIENSDIGGTCLNRGCIPSKLLIHGAEILKQLEHAKDFGITVKPKIDFSKAMQHQRNTIKIAKTKAETSAKSMKNIKLIKGTAKLKDKNTVIITDNRNKNNDNNNNKSIEINGKFIMIALGGTPITPKINGIEKIKYFDSNNIWQLKTQPKSIFLLGGGYISIEFAFFFAMYGTKVYIVNRSERILGREDSEVAETLTQCLRKIGIEIILDESINKIEKSGKEYLFFLNKRTIKAELLMINTGRKPNTQNIGLEELKIQTENGFIKVNEYLQTSISNIYAIGDINGLAPFAHTGKVEAEIAVNNIFNIKKKMDYAASPYAVFTYPQIGAVGMSEDELIEKKIEYEKHIAYFESNGKAKIIGETNGFVKVMFSKEGKLLGARIIGENASELIHEFILLMNSEGNHKEILQKTIHIHPTLSEVNEDLF